MKKILYELLIFSFATIYCFAQEQQIEGWDGRPGVYNADTKTASLGQGGDRTFYSNVVEYDRAVTPPSVTNPDMQAFATFTKPVPNSSYASRSGRKGGGGGWVTSTVTLYGIPQESTEVNEVPMMMQKAVKKSQKSFEIYGSKGEYDPADRTAYLTDAQGNNKIEYTNVIEYKQAVTPPGSKFTLFATMPNPDYKESDKYLMGGQFKNIQLFGIKKEKSKKRFKQQSDIDINQIEDIV